MHSHPELSVIIPTHKRAGILRRCLEHIEAQSIAKQLEVVVVSDGHDDETAALFAKPSWHVPVRFLEIEKAQQGVARNRGVAQAKANTCLFIGDDIFLQKDACEAHLMIHALAESDEFAHHGTTAVLGYTTWDPALSITPVMEWLEQSGWQFGYPAIAQYAMRYLPPEIQHRYTYTSHISLPTEIARDIPFRQDVLLYGWEDIEWGTRLKAAGVRLFYEDTAKAHHHHAITLEESLRRMETLGKSAVRVSELVPGFDRMPPPWKRIAYRIAILLRPRSLASLHRKAFLRGISGASAE